MKKLAILLLLTIFLACIPFLSMAETNEIIILLKDSDKFFNERNYNKYLEVSKTLSSKNKSSIPILVEAKCKLSFETYQRQTTEISMQGKIDDNTNFIILWEELKFINQPQKYENKELNELFSKTCTYSAIIYDNDNNIIECCETLASYKLKKTIQELKNSISAKLYFEKGCDWVYQYDISTKELEILTSGLLLSKGYRDCSPNDDSKIKIVFNNNSKTYQMFLGTAKHYYIQELPGCVGDYSVENNNVLFNIIYYYSIFSDNYLYWSYLEPDFFKTIPLPTLEIICKLKMTNIRYGDKTEHCLTSYDEKYSYSKSGLILEVNCSKHGQVIRLK